MKRLAITQAFSAQDMAHRALVNALKVRMREDLTKAAARRGTTLKPRHIVTTEWDEVISQDTGETLHFVSMRADIP